MASGGISGVAVALASAGGILLYAGFQGQSPLAALKDVTSGKAKALTPSKVSFSNDPTQVGKVVAAGYSTGSGFGPSLVAAVMTHKDDKYSQAKRWAAGFSDCSSIIGKGLKDIGVTPPGASTTLNYRAWSKLKTIPRDQIQEGDFLCGSGHIALALDGQRAVGQQNPRQNVRIDSIDNIMYGQVGWVPRRYIGAASGSSSSGAGSYAT